MKYANVASERSHIQIPSHFSLNKFTLVTIGNFAHVDRSSFSGVLSTHDTAMTLFQMKPLMYFLLQSEISH